MTSIYTLEHPLTGEVRYVGKTTKNLQIRYWNHLASTSRTYVIAWIKSLKKVDLLPVIKLIEEVDDSLGAETEMYWIAQFRNWGFKLTNLSNGGEGPTGVTRSLEYRQKVSAKHKGKTVSNETREKIRAANLGKKLTQETLIKIKQNRTPPTKPIYQIKDDKIIAEFNSAIEASKITGQALSSIRAVLCGARNSNNGYYWRIK